MDLFICTASQHPSFWILDDDSKIIAALRENPTASDNLSNLVQELLDQASIAKEQLDKVFVITGPGSFTSLRKGVNFARGLSLGLNIPLFGLPTRSLFNVDVWIPLRPRIACEQNLNEALENGLEFLQIKSGREHVISNPTVQDRVLGLKEELNWPSDNEVQSAHENARSNLSAHGSTDIDYGLEVKISGKRQTK